MRKTRLKKVTVTEKESSFKKELAALGPVSHVRLNLFPDGGVSRFRVLGRVAS